MSTTEEWRQRELEKYTRLAAITRLQAAECETRYGDTRPTWISRANLARYERMRDVFADAIAYRSKP